MAIAFDDPFVERLFERTAALVTDGSGDAASVHADHLELAAANSPAVADYWRRTSYGMGVPDAAFRGESPYLFPDEPPKRTFRTSGTTSANRGSAYYSSRGMALMDASILAQARRHVVAGLDAPVIVRLVPQENDAPEMVMAHGMELISRALGHRDLSACVVGTKGVDFPLLTSRLEAATAEGLPVVLIGGSFAFVNVCDTLLAQGRSFRLPAGSRMIDAGGFKGRSRVVGVDALRDVAMRAFGIAAGACVNLFGMTELASQLYDAADVGVGPLGERPKGSTPFVVPSVRDPQDLTPKSHGAGLLEVTDLCILDRPHVVLTGDRAIATRDGVAIVGRIERGQSRGCSLTLDAMTGQV